MNPEPRFTAVALHESRTFAVCLAGTAAAFVASQALAPQVAVPPRGAYCAAFACVVAASLAVSRFAPRSLRAGGAVVVAAAAALTLVAASSGKAPGWPSALAVALALLAGGSSGGAIVGARIQHAGHLLFVVLASSVADAYSVTAPEGPSAAIARSEAALSLLAVAWPMFGTRNVEPLLGAGDIVFTGLYLAWARRHTASPRRTLIALAGGYGVTMLTVLVLEVAVPALPFLGGAMLVAHPEARRPPAADRRRGWVVLSLMAALFLVLFLRPGE